MSKTATQLHHVSTNRAQAGSTKTSTGGSSLLSAKASGKDLQKKLSGVISIEIPTNPPWHGQNGNRGLTFWCPSGTEQNWQKIFFLCKIVVGFFYLYTFLPNQGYFFSQYVASFSV